jgi:hypothetical protein
VLINIFIFSYIKHHYEKDNFTDVTNKHITNSAEQEAVNTTEDDIKEFKFYSGLLVRFIAQLYSETYPIFFILIRLYLKNNYFSFYILKSVPLAYKLLSVTLLGIYGFSDSDYATFIKISFSINLLSVVLHIGHTATSAVQDHQKSRMNDLH